MRLPVAGFQWPVTAIDGVTPDWQPATGNRF
jgi:hypothetical protein